MSEIALLDKILSYYVIYSKKGIFHLSPNFKKIAQEDFYLELQKPFHTQISFALLKELTDMVLFFNISGDKNKIMKGQCIPYKKFFLIICNPVLVDLNQLSSFNIGLYDLPIHDLMGDFLFAIETSKISLIEAKSSNQKLAESLETTKRLSENLANEVEIKTEKYKIEKEHAEIAVGELQALQSEMMRVEKLSALGNLVYGIAHEINTPLAVIKTNHALLKHNLRDLFKGSQMIISSFNASEKEIFYEIVEKCITNKEYLNHKQERQRRKLVEIQLEDLCEKEYIEEFAISFSIIGLLPPYDLYFKFLSISKFKTILKLTEVVLRHRNSLSLIENAIEKVSRTVFALKNYTENGETNSTFLISSIENQISHVLNIYESYIVGKILIEKNFNSEVGKIKISEEFINVWKILIYNSIQVSSFFKKEININIEKEDDYLKVEIQDNGSGIAIENQDKVFTPFFTTKESGEGIGLGLYTAKKIIENNAGSIDFFSDFTGTIFNIQIKI